MNTTPHEKIEYFLYARKSSESEERQVQSIDDQIKCLKELASKLHITVKEIFTESKSAKMPYIRPVFAQMMKRIEKGEANGILAWELNRISRNPVDSGMVDWLLQRGIIRCVQTISRRYMTEDNVIIFNVDSSMANQFIIDLRKNCYRGMVGKAERGWFPGVPPIGYLNDKAEKTIIVDTERFSLIRKMWDMLLSGNYMPSQIREIANEDWGFRTRAFKRRGNGPLCNSTIYKMFTNVFYAGLFEWNGKLYNGKHMPMITLEEYDRVQLLLRNKGRPRPKTHTFSFTGLMRCGECGCMITATEKQKLLKKTNTLKTYVYYHCTKKRYEMKCSQKPVILQYLEQQIDTMLSRYSLLPEFEEWIKEIIAQELEKRTVDRSTIRISREQSLVKIENELANLTKMRYRELIDDVTFINEKEELNNAIVRLKQQLQEDTNNEAKWLELTARALQFAIHARENFSKGTEQQRREVFAALGSNFLLKDKKLFIDNAEWLTILEKGCPPLNEQLGALEPIKSPFVQTQNEYYASLFPTLCALVEDVRTYFLTNTDKEINIPDLQQIYLEAKHGNDP